MAIDLLGFKDFSPETLYGYVRQRYRDLIYDPERWGERILRPRFVNDYEVNFGKVRVGRPPAAPVVAVGSKFPEFSFESSLDEKKFRGMKLGLRTHFREDSLSQMRQIVGLDGGAVSPESIINADPFSVADRMLSAIMDIMEVMRWDLLANDSFVVSPQYSISWDVPAVNKYTLTGTDVWSDLVNADGIGDLQKMNEDAILRYGSSIREVYMPYTALQNLKAQESTKRRLAGQGYMGLGPQLDATAAQYGVVSEAMIQQYIANNRSNNSRNTSQGIQIYTYDRRYGKYDYEGTGSPVETRFLPENKIVAITDDPLTRNQPVMVNQPEGNSIGFVGLNPVAENNWRSGPYFWIEQTTHPFTISAYITAWATPVADGERIFQMQIGA